MSGSGIKLSNLVELTAADLEPTLREQLATAPAVAAPVAGVFGLASETAVKKICDSLDADVIDVLAGAWSQASALHGYKDATKHPPEQIATVNLGQHDITATEEPVIEMTIAHAHVAELRLTITMSIRVKSVALSIQAGRIIAVAPGECSVRAQVKYKTHVLKECETPSLAFPGRMQLGNGIAIP